MKPRLAESPSCTRITCKGAARSNSKRRSRTTSPWEPHLAKSALVGERAAIFFTRASPRRRTTRTWSSRRCRNQAWCRSGPQDRAGASRSTRISCPTWDPPLRGGGGKGVARSRPRSRLRKSASGTPERPLPNSRRSRSSATPTAGARSPPNKGEREGRGEGDQPRRRRRWMRLSASTRGSGGYSREGEALEKHSRAADGRWEKERRRAAVCAISARTLRSEPGVRIAGIRCSWVGSSSPRFHPERALVRCRMQLLAVQLFRQHRCRI
jgi:hypothetical protein